MTGAPVVSVIIIFRDAERFIEEAIESVLTQAYAAWELLLVDDGSSDLSTQIAQRYTHQDPGRIRYLTHPGQQNRGMSASRNLGIAEARGEYVAFLDSDDVWLPQRLVRHLDVLESHRDVAMVYGPTLQWFSWTGDPADAERDHVRELWVQPDRRYEPPFLLARFLEEGGGNLPGICSLLVRRPALLELGGFEEEFRSVFEDQVMLSKICLAKPVYVIDECLDRYRQHPNSCCAVAQRQGEYDPNRPNPRQRAYLEWLERHVAERGVDDQRLWQALHVQLLAYRSPLRYWIVTAPRWAPYALKRSLRRLGLLPSATRRPPATI